MAEEQRPEGPQEGSGQTETAADIRPDRLHHHRHHTGQFTVGEGRIFSLKISEETGEEPEQEEACQVTTAGRRSSTAGLSRKEIVSLHYSLSWHRRTEGTLTKSPVSLPIILNYDVYRSQSKNKPLELSHHCSFPLVTLSLNSLKVNRAFTNSVSSDIFWTTKEQRYSSLELLVYIKKGTFSIELKVNGKLLSIFI